MLLLFSFTLYMCLLFYALVFLMDGWGWMDGLTGVFVWEGMCVACFQGWFGVCDDLCEQGARATDTCTPWRSGPLIQLGLRLRVQAEVAELV
jgi:hypothetical protein